MRTCSLSQNKGQIPIAFSDSIAIINMSSSEIMGTWVLRGPILKTVAAFLWSPVARHRRIRRTEFLRGIRGAAGNVGSFKTSA